MTESMLYEQLAGWMNLTHPGVPYHFDLSGLWTPSHKARNLYGRLNRRAWPDLFVAFTGWTDGPTGASVYCGLFIELKREGTKLKKRDGSWVNVHIAEQARVLEELASRGYIAQFAVGFDEATQLIDSYLGARQ